eukprot:GHVU01087089.1.p1 GENE.GHVU01087089.1~~GHVU01087089.1.p1  ORF type:complete len:156 (+),score=1.41 GHVU01087089.1:530-997(+)
MYIYITSSRDNTVYRLDRDGRNKRTFNNQGLKSPQYIAASSNSVAVSSCGSDQVSVYDSAGRQLYVYGGFGSGPGQLNGPRGVVLDKWGKLLVEDYWNNRVCIVSPHGQHEGGIKLDKEGLNFPCGVALTKDGQLIVTCGWYSTTKAVAIYQYCN